MFDTLRQPAQATESRQADEQPLDALFDRLTDALSGLQGDSSVRQTAADAVAGASSRLPFLDRVQSSFGSFDVSGVRAATDARAAESTAALGVEGLTTGGRVALGPDADLHTVAHEAAHVVQQQSGVHLASGTGRQGDRYERHADAVADLVVQGRSAEGLLAEEAGVSGGVSRAAGPVQFSLAKGFVLSYPKLKKLLSALSLKPKLAKKVENICENLLREEPDTTSGLGEKLEKIRQEARLDAAWDGYKSSSVEPRKEPKLLWEDGEKIKKMGSPKMTTLAEDTPLWGEEGPQLEDIKQGHIGDCFLLAAAGAVLRRDPEIIRSMFVDHGSTVTVRLFHGGEPKLIKVTKSVPKLHDKNERTDPYAGDALWVQLLEKAMACLPHDDSGDYKDISGGDTLSALKALTGHSEEVETGLTEEESAEQERSLPWPKGDIPHDTKDFKQKKHLEAKNKLYLEIFGEEDAKDWTSFVKDNEQLLPLKNASSLSDLQSRLDGLQKNGKIKDTTAKKLQIYAKEKKLFPSHEGSDWYTKEDLALFKRVSEALAKGKGVTACTKGELRGDLGGDGMSGEAKVDGLVTGHAYTVIDTSEDNDRKWIRVRNPWGKYGREYETDLNGVLLEHKGELLPRAVEKGDGISKLDLADFAMSFDKIGAC